MGDIKTVWRPDELEAMMPNPGIAALAEGLRQTVPGFAWRGPVMDALAATPPVAELLRLAAIGRAVEGLEETGLDWRIARDVKYRPHYSVTVYSDSAMADDINVDADTLPAALAAALGEQPPGLGDF